MQNYNQYKQFNPKFGIVASQILNNNQRASSQQISSNNPSLMMQIPYNQNQYMGYPSTDSMTRSMQGLPSYMYSNYDNPSMGGNYYDVPPPQTFWRSPMMGQNGVIINPYLDDDDSDSDFEETDTIIKLMDKQRTMLEKFSNKMKENRQKFFSFKAKKLNEKINKLEKKNMFKNMLVDDHEFRLKKNMEAPYIFDDGEYKKVDSASESDEEEDDFLMTLLQKPELFKRFKKLVQEKKQKQEEAIRARAKATQKNRRDNPSDIDDDNDDLSNKSVPTHKSADNKKILSDSVYQNSPNGDQFTKNQTIIIFITVFFLLLRVQ